MHVYRISRKQHANALDGAGARLYGGRWNKAGTPCIYTSESRALAILEYSVNVNIEDIPADLVIITFKIQDDLHNIYAPTQLPETWNSTVVMEATQEFGTTILKKLKHLLVKIPSVIIPQEHNYLINPRHPQIKKVQITDISPFSLDPRLKK